MRKSEEKKLIRIILSTARLPEHLNEDSVGRFIKGENPFPKEKYFFLEDLLISQKVKVSIKLENLLNEKFSNPIIRKHAANVTKSFDLKPHMKEKRIKTLFKQNGFNYLSLGQVIDLVLNGTLLSYVSVGSTIIPVKIKRQSFLFVSSFMRGIIHLDYMDPNTPGTFSLGIVIGDKKSP